MDKTLPPSPDKIVPLIVAVFPLLEGLTMEHTSLIALITDPVLALT